jgi:dihydrofolate reductase
VLYSTTFLTLDGVMSDPHLWHPAFVSAESLAILGEHLDAADAMLLGRRTYEEFASYWPNQDDSVLFARRTNEVPKHVVTRSIAAPEWTNSSVVGGDLLMEVSRLKQANAQIMLPGSATLVRALLNLGVLDEMRFYLDPIVLGHGQRLFDHGLVTISLELVDQRSLPKGVQYLAYRPTARHADG